MKQITKFAVPKAQQGIAAVEMAVLLPLVLVVLLTVPLYFGRCFYHYTAMQKAAHDAARYLSTVSIADMRNPSRGDDAAAVASFIAHQETLDLSPGGIYPIGVTTLCWPAGSCNLGVPTSVQVVVSTRMFDPIFGTSFAGDAGLILIANYQMTYVGS
jgi:hypothetical protein